MKVQGETPIGQVRWDRFGNVKITKVFTESNLN